MTTHFIEKKMEHIYLVGNAHDMHSNFQCGLVPLKRDRHSVSSTAVNPMYTHQNQEEVQYDLNNSRIAVYKNTWKTHQHTVYWCILKLAQRKGLQFYQTRSNAITRFNSLPGIRIEKVVNMKAGEELYSKVHQSPRLPRAVLNSEFASWTSGSF